MRHEPGQRIEMNGERGFVGAVSDDGLVVVRMDTPRTFTGDYVPDDPLYWNPDFVKVLGVVDWLAELDR